MAALILGVLFLIVYGLGFHYILVEVEQQFGSRGVLQKTEIINFLLMSGMYVVNFLTVIMTVLTSVDTLSGEISSGTIQSLVSKPIRRWEIVLGKWLGFSIMLTLYLLLMGGGTMGIVFLRAGYIAPHPIQGLGFILLDALILLTVSLLGGTRFSTLANGVMVFGLYGIAFIGGWIEQIGTFFTNVSANQAAINIGIISSLIMPSEALWKRAVHELQSPLVTTLGFSPWTGQTYPSNIMILYSFIYLFFMLGMAIYFFHKRDL